MIAGYRKCTAIETSSASHSSKYHNSPAGQVGVTDVVSENSYDVYVKNGPIEKDLAYVRILDNVENRRYFKPEQFVRKDGVPTLMDMDGCVANTRYLAHQSVNSFTNDVCFPSMASFATEEQQNAGDGEKNR